MIMSRYTTNENVPIVIESSFLTHIRSEDKLIRKVHLSMDEQKKYEVIKGLADHPQTANKDRTALTLGCTRRHINRMIKGY